MGDEVFVSFVVEGGAADRAGIKAGDILLSIQGKQLAFEQLPDRYGLTNESLKHIRSHQSGGSVEFQILRQRD